MIEVSVVRLPPEAETFVLEVLRSGRLAQGPVVERFEQAIAGAVDAEHAVAVNSGTAALQAALLGLGIGEGDEVVTSAFTFVRRLIGCGRRRLNRTTSGGSSASERTPTALKSRDTDVSDSIDRKSVV